MRAKTKGDLPFTLQELMESVSGAGDKDDELALVLASPADGIETGITKGLQKTGVLIFSFLDLLSCLQF